MLLVFSETSEIDVFVHFRYFVYSFELVSRNDPFRNPKPKNPVSNWIWSYFCDSVLLTHQDIFMFVRKKSSF